MELPMQQAQFMLRLAPDDMAFQRPSDQVVLSGPAGDVCLGDGTRWLRVLTGIDLTAALADASAGYCPDWLVAAVAGRLQGTPLASVASIRRATAKDDPLSCAMEFSLQQDGHLIVACAQAAPETWLGLLEDCDVSSLCAPVSMFLDVAWSQPVVLGRHRLAVSSCDALAAGDIILPAQAGFDTTGAGKLRLAGRNWRVHYLAPGQLQLISLEPSVDMESAEHFDDGVPPDSPLQEHEDADEDEDEAQAPLDELPLTLVFELGRVALPLGALRSLAPQTVLSLQAGSPRNIGILCEGRRVGQGEVVDVDGALGIRITQWGRAC
jgi:type III secretion protein Q